MAARTSPNSALPAGAAQCRTAVAALLAAGVRARQPPAILRRPAQTPLVQSTPPGPCQPCSAPLTLPRKSANGRVWRHHGHSPVPLTHSEALLALRFKEDLALTGMVGLA